MKRQQKPGVPQAERENILKSIDALLSPNGTSGLWERANTQIGISAQFKRRMTEMVCSEEEQRDLAARLKPVEEKSAKGYESLSRFNTDEAAVKYREQQAGAVVRINAGKPEEERDAWNAEDWISAYRTQSRAGRALMDEAGREAALILCPFAEELHGRWEEMSEDLWIEEYGRCAEWGIPFEPSQVAVYCRAAARGLKRQIGLWSPNGNIPANAGRPSDAVEHIGIAMEAKEGRHNAEKKAAKVAHFQRVENDIEQDIKKQQGRMEAISKQINEAKERHRALCEKVDKARQTGAKLEDALNNDDLKFHNEAGEIISRLRNQEFEVSEQIEKGKLKLQENRKLRAEAEGKK